VGQIDQNLNTARDNVMRRFAVNVDEETNTARIMLILWAVQALFGGKTVGGNNLIHYVLRGLELLDFDRLSDRRWLARPVLVQKCHLILSGKWSHSWLEDWSLPDR
jgi:hypothetical protein